MLWCFQIFAIVPWVLSLAFFIATVIKKLYVYDLWSYSWYYDYDLLLSNATYVHLIFYVDCLNSLVQVGMSITWYILMLIGLKTLVKNTKII